MRYVWLLSLVIFISSCKSYQGITKPGNYAFKASVSGAQVDQSLKGVFSIDSSSVQLILFGPLNMQIGRAIIQSQEVILIDLFNKRIFFIELNNAYKKLNSFFCKKVTGSEQEILKRYLVCLLRISDGTLNDNLEIYTFKCDKGDRSNCFNIEGFDNRKFVNNRLVNHCDGLITDFSLMIKKKPVKTIVRCNLEKYNDFKHVTVYIDE